MDKQQGAKLFLIFLICSLCLVLALFWAYVSSIILALLIVSVTYPLYARLRGLLRGREPLAALFMSILIFLVLAIPVGWFVGTLSNEAFDLYRRSSGQVTLDQIRYILEHDPVWSTRIKTIGKMTGLEITSDSVEELASAIGKHVGLFLYNQVRSMASNVFSFLVHFFLMILTTYFLFRDGALLKDYIIRLLPVPQGQVEKLAEKFHEMSQAIIVGNGLNGVIQGILGGIGFFLFGLKAPFLWGTVIAFMAFLPIIGSTIVFVPAGAILLIQGNIGIGLGFLAYNACYAAIMEYLVKPRLIGHGMNMSSILVFLGILGGMKLFGILGIIFGPLIITLFLTLAEIYRLEYREQSL